MKPIEKVVLYTMNYCPYCLNAKQLLKQREVPYEEVLVQEEDSAQWESLYERSGMRTMPQIFLGDRLIGGYTDLVALDRQDSLESLKKS